MMAHDRRAEFGFDPETLLEKYCPVCGELRPVRTERDNEGAKRYFCAKRRAPLGEEVADSFEKPEPDFPDA
jgi:hypothetical protein